jgi:hypothetical protein
VSPATELGSDLRDALESRGEPGATELLCALQELAAGAGLAGPASGLTHLKHHVYRLTTEPGAGRRSLILKRCEPRTAQLTRLVGDRWLPAIGLGDRCARVLATVPERQGRWVWQVFEDLGDETLEGCADRPRVEAAVDLVADLHTRAAGHPLLPEVRHYGEDLGLSYFIGNVQDAIRGLEAMSGAAPLPPEALAVRDRLLQRLYPLVADTPRRAQVLQEAGGPDTLLHGDLWRVNTFVNITEGEARARLIDWDHTGVGPSSYDLSTFLTRFPPGDRPWILSRYQQAIVRAGWRLPTEQELDTLFETAEYARFANRIAWAAMAWLHDHAEWSPVELAEIERWFEAWRPVLARPGVTS